MKHLLLRMKHLLHIFAGNLSTFVAETKTIY